MAFKPIDLSVFPPERERGLKELYRYSRFELMYYRSNLWMHSWRMLWLTEALAPLAQIHVDGIDIEKARTLALVHDDAELECGDVQAGTRALMNAKELADVDARELEGIERLTTRFPNNVNGYEYKELLLSMLHKDSLEAQFISYVDKLDAFCESMHEMQAGNTSLLESVMFYGKYFSQFPAKYPAFSDFAAERSSPLTFLDDRNDRERVPAKEYADLQPYTRESITRRTNFPFYDAWKDLVIERGGEEGLGWLIDQKEHKMA